MNYLTLENVTKTYGEKVLFNGIEMHIDRGQKIALVAKNGTGKTTLLRVLAGLEGSEGEQSKIIIKRDIRTGFLHQEPDFYDRHTVMEAVFASESPLIQTVRRYELAMQNPQNEDEMQTALSGMDEHKAWDFEAKIQEILSKLKITRLDQEVGTLSGGQKKRLALAQLLIEDPEFLILDEPTNHLDVDMIEWLEKYLQQPAITLFMVTHDRYFLDRICNNIIELDGGILYRYKGNYGDYLEKKAIRAEVDAATMDKNKKLYSKELDWVRRQPQARSTKAKSRVDAFYDLKELTQKKVENDEMQIEIKAQWLGSKIVEAHNISKSYGDRTLLDSFSYKFRRKERVGIIGPNGAGKSTLIKMLTGELQPDSGKVVIGDTIIFGHYNQDGIQLKTDKRVIEVIRDIAEFIPLEKGQKLTAVALLERFLFSREQQQVYVSQLSGGERRRLYMLTVLMKNPNFLILDEPTNDLDILTLNVLEDFLVDYPGCLLIVTHDRYFMDKLVEHLFVFEEKGQIRDFNGTYSDYREFLKIQELAEREKSREADKKPVAAAVVKEVENAKQLSQDEKKELKRLERDIEKFESQKKEITKKFDNPNLSPDDIMRLSKELGELQNAIEEKEIRWLELAE